MVGENRKGRMEAGEQDGMGEREEAACCLLAWRPCQSRYLTGG